MKRLLAQIGVLTGALISAPVALAGDSNIRPYVPTAEELFGHLGQDCRYVPLKGVGTGCLFGRASTPNELVGEPSFFPWSLECKNRLDRIWDDRHASYADSDKCVSCKVILAADGEVRSVEIFKSLNSPIIDKEVIELVKEAGPFLPIPETTRVRTFSFQFLHFPKSSYVAITPARPHDFDTALRLTDQR